MLQRKTEWAGALDAFFGERHASAFRYGQHDCALFACDAIFVMTGIDIAHEFRGRYKTRKAAMDAAKAVTGTASVLAIAKHVTTNFDMREIAPNMLQRGDVAMIRRGARDHSLGVVSLTGRTIIVPSATGTVEIALDLALTGWRV